MIASHVEFEDMAYGYSLYQEPADIADLAAWWHAEYGVAFPETPDLDAASLARGRELSADSCVDCHSRPQWAFASWAVSRAAAPVSPALARRDASGLVVDAHFLLAFLALALAPFTKFFHVLTSPVLIMAREAADPATTHPANLATLRAMELDACMHCTTCSVHCSVAAAAGELPGRSVLPSEKLSRLGRLAAGQSLGPEEERELLAGNELCTRCYRCTRLCPAGINLQDLWESLSADLMARGLAEPHAAARSALHQRAESQRELPELRFRRLDKEWLGGLTSHAKSFAGCYNCRTCTASCPVVKAFPEPVAELDLLPHQIMHALGLGMREEALGARMVWDCLTCYRCQEACPQGVKVTEVLAELRNLASAQLRNHRKDTA
jgi:heterodisulfide reductase subunit C